MQVTLSSEMVNAVRDTPEAPANLLESVEKAESVDGAWSISLTGDERIAMEEMCQWYIQKDPDTGELTDKGKLYNSIIDALYDADED